MYHSTDQLLVVNWRKLYASPPLQLSYVGVAGAGFYVSFSSACWFLQFLTKDYGTFLLLVHFSISTCRWDRHTGRQLGAAPIMCHQMIWTKFITHFFVIDNPLVILIRISDQNHNIHRKKTPKIPHYHPHYPVRGRQFPYITWNLLLGQTFGTDAASPYHMCQLM